MGHLLDRLTIPVLLVPLLANRSDHPKRSGKNKRIDPLAMVAFHAALLQIRPNMICLSFTHSPTPFVLNLLQLSFPFCAPCRDQPGKALIVFAHPDSLSKERWQLMLLAEPLVLPVHRPVIPTY
jgi:hypothetical protein